VSKRSFFQSIFYMFLGISVLITLVPIVWMLSTSLKSPEHVFTFPIEWLPDALHVENYVQALGARPFFLYLFNSILASSVSVLITVVISSAAGYSFAHFKFPGRDILFIVVLSTIMIPFEVIAVPLYLQIYHWGWVDSYAGLILPTSLSAIGIFIMRQYMMGIPKDFIESARIDGASELQILTRIMWPMSLPAMSAVAIFSFVATWNSYLWPLLIINDDTLRTLPLGMALYENQLTVTYNRIMAVAVFGAMPVVLLFVMLQKNFVKGIALTGLKEG
jgi:ABC-type glycerol-3-phosphate transport system permease component